MGEKPINNGGQATVKPCQFTLNQKSILKEDEEILSETSDVDSKCSGCSAMPQCKSILEIIPIDRNKALVLLREVRAANKNQ